MLDLTKLRTATLAGTILQLAMVIAGHFIPAVAAAFAAGGMGISLVAGLLYGRGTGAWAGALVGGALAGGLCALIGIAVSVLLGDVPLFVLAFGTVSSAVTGLVGGAIGKLVGGAGAR
jgi:hypothetical protein